MIRRLAVVSLACAASASAEEIRLLISRNKSKLPPRMR
jgi:hypothetical protein